MKIIPYINIYILLNNLIYLRIIKILIIYFLIKYEDIFECNYKNLKYIFHKIGFTPLEI